MIIKKCEKSEKNEGVLDMKRKKMYICEFMLVL